LNSDFGSFHIYINTTQTCIRFRSNQSMSASHGSTTYINCGSVRWTSDT